MLLEKRLKLLSVSDDQISNLANQLMASQQALFDQKEKEGARALLSPKDATPQIVGISPNDETDSARDLACKIIRHMTYADIRLMQLPFGAVFDAMIARK